MAKTETIQYHYNNGNLRWEESYHEGQRHGIFKHWHRNEEFCCEDYYLYGNKVTKEEYRKHELIEKLSGL